jgi:hypothetical protein
LQQIRGNLCQFLLAIRQHRSRKQLTWINQMRISRNDVLDKNHQVQLMRCVCQQAEIVITRLGGGAPKCLEAYLPEYKTASIIGNGLESARRFLRMSTKHLRRSQTLLVLNPLPLDSPGTLLARSNREHRSRLEGYDILLLVL